MKSIKGKLIIYFCTLLIIITSATSFFAYAKSAKGMEMLETQLLSEKLKGNIAAATFYFEKYFGNVHYKDGQLIDENGKNIEGRDEMVDAILDDMGVVATIFAKSGDDFKRITTNILKEDGQRADYRSCRKSFSYI